VGSGAGSGSGGEDAARTALLSLQLPSLRLAPDAPQVHEIEWHPTRPLLAAADVGGCVSFYRVRRPAPRAAAAPRRSAASAAAKKKAREELPFGGHKLEAQLTHHSGSVRSIVFHPNGDFAYSGSADKSIGQRSLSSLRHACP
jgi:WD40 repeat protein